MSLRGALLWRTQHADEWRSRIWPMLGKRFCMARHLEIGRPRGWGVAGHQHERHPLYHCEAYQYPFPHRLRAFTTSDQSIFTETDFFFASSVFDILTSNTPSLKFALIWSPLTSLGNSTLRTNDPYERSLR